MWNIDLSYREEFQSTFDRLYDKLLCSIKIGRRHILLYQKLKSRFQLSGLIIRIVLKEIHYPFEKHKWYFKMELQ